MNRSASRPVKRKSLWGRLASIARRGATLLRRRGLPFVRYVVAGVAWPKLRYRLTSGPLRPAAPTRPLGNTLRQATLWTREAEIAPAAVERDGDIRLAVGYGAAEWDWHLRPSDEIVLPVSSPGVQQVALWNGAHVSIRRTYADRGAFARECAAFRRLEALGIPLASHIDAAVGTVLLTLPAAERLDGVLVHATEESRDQLERALDVALHAIHSAGITGVGTDPRTVLVSSGAVLFTDFARAVHDERLNSLGFAGKRDADREALAQATGLPLLTERTARESLEGLRQRLTSYQDYAPIDFGLGLTLGNILTSDSGSGRWEYFNGRVVSPLVRGKRVLDLGSNNGSMPTAMLRAGARDVHCVELNDSLADLCLFSARLFEWRDMRQYNLTMHRGSMTRFLTEPWGPFDVVTAFCSLYYLPEAEMAAMVRRAAAMDATLILQSNEGIDPSLQRVARADYLRELMLANGYNHVETHCPAGYQRALIIGQRVSRPLGVMA